jgi:hypothetical protein
MGKINERPYWFPKLTDAEWIARVRADYPEKTEGMSDEWVRVATNMRTHGTTWALADAYLSLLKR